MMLLLCCCSSEQPLSEEKIITNEKATADSAVKISFPTPTKATTEESDNAFGARYCFTIEVFTDMLNDCYAEMSNGESKEKFSYDKWQVLSQELCDDNSVKYSSYYYMTDAITIIASVEDESKKVMNVGCGCTYAAFNDSKDNFSYSVLTMAAMLSSVAGGYETDKMEFLYYIYLDAVSSKKSFYYNNSAYVMTLKDNGDDDNSVVLFMSSPVSNDSKEKLMLTDYKTYDESVRPD